MAKECLQSAVNKHGNYVKLEVSGNWYTVTETTEQGDFTRAETKDLASAQSEFEYRSR